MTKNFRSDSNKMVVIPMGRVTFVMSDRVSYIGSMGKKQHHLCFGIGTGNPIVNLQEYRSWQRPCVMFVSIHAERMEQFGDTKQAKLFKKMDGGIFPCVSINHDKGIIRVNIGSHVVSVLMRYCTLYSTDEHGMVVGLETQWRKRLAERGSKALHDIIKTITDDVVNTQFDMTCEGIINAVVFRLHQRRIAPKDWHRVFIGKYLTDKGLFK